MTHKHPTWECPSCKYKWLQSIGALPVRAACPSCGAEVPEIAKALEAAKAKAEEGGNG